MINIPPLFFALAATLCFAYSSTIFTDFSRMISPFWMNSFKAFVALFAFFITRFFLHEWVLLDFKIYGILMTSGLIGLMIGDIFMLHAMKEIGASRMLMIFGLQPFFLGLGGYYFFNQSFSTMNFLGVLSMLCCLYIISLESYKKNGHWHIRGMILGLIAIILDGTGILLTRSGFDSSPGISPIEVNFIRCIGAVIGFFIINLFFTKKENQVKLNPTWNNLTRHQKIRLLSGSLGGTYLSLLLYLTAVSRGQLSVISAVSATGPMFAAFFECLKSKKLPSIYLFTSLLFFICGFLIFTRI